MAHRCTGSATRPPARGRALRTTRPARPPPCQRLPPRPPLPPAPRPARSMQPRTPLRIPMQRQAMGLRVTLWRPAQMRLRLLRAGRRPARGARSRTRSASSAAWCWWRWTSRRCASSTACTRAASQVRHPVQCYLLAHLQHRPQILARRWPAYGVPGSAGQVVLSPSSGYVGNHSNMRLRFAC